MNHYLYEILGGILIFVSSVVSEQMPRRWRIGLWIAFGLMAIGYTGIGIYLDRQEGIKQAADRKEQREDAKRISGNLDNLLTAFSLAMPQINSINSEMAILRRQVEASRERRDPRLMKELEAAQKHADLVSKDILVALAPTIADRMEKISTSWNEEAHNQDMIHNDLPYQQIPDKLQREQELDAEMAKTDKQYGPKVKTIVRQADSLRQEILQKLPPEARTAEDRKMETRFGELRKSPSLRLYSVSEEAKYLRELGERLSQETQ